MVRRAEGGRVMIRGSNRSAEITEGDQRQRETQQASGPLPRFPGDNTWGRAAVNTLAGRRQIDTEGRTDWSASPQLVRLREFSKKG